MVSVPVRGAVVVFAATVNPALDDPVPPAPAVIHGTLELEDHAQPFGAVTPTLPAPPAAPIDWLPDARLNVHATPDCVIGNELDATSTRVVRLDEEVLGATVKAT